MTKNKTSLLALFFAAGLVASGAAQAVECSTCVRETVAQANDTRSSINGTIDSMKNSVVNAVDYARDGIIKAISRQSSAITKQSANSSQAQQQTVQNAAIASAQIEATKGIAPLQCAAASSSNGGASGGYRRAGVSEPRFYSPTNISKNYMYALNQASQTTTPALPPKDSAAQAGWLAAGSCETFGDPRSSRGLLCISAGFPYKNLNVYRDADVRASTLFDGPQKPGGSEKMLSIPTTGAARDARAAYLASLDTPIRPETPSSAALRTPEGQALLGRLTEYRALKDLAIRPARELDALTTSDPQNSKTLQILLKDPLSKRFVDNYITTRSLELDGVSPVEMMNIEIERRVGNEDWIVGMSGKTSEEKIAELLAIEAYQARVRFQQLQATRETNVLLGQLLSQQIDTVLRPKIDAANVSLKETSARLTNK